MTAKAHQGTSGEIKQDIEYAAADAKAGATNGRQKPGSAALALAGGTVALTSAQALATLLAVSGGVPTSFTLPVGTPDGFLYSVVNSGTANATFGTVVVAPATDALIATDHSATGGFVRMSANVAPTP